MGGMNGNRLSNNRLSDALYDLEEEKDESALWDRLENPHFGETHS